MQAQISLLIDYAHEPESLTLFLQTLQSWKKLGYFDILVHVLSSDGVGRDDWKKPIMGNLSYKYADFTILTTDNYGKDDNPKSILALLGKNFLHKDEQLTQEWLDKIQNHSLNSQNIEKQLKSKPKVKFLLEIDRKKALAKALKVGLFLAQNYEVLDFDETFETKTLSKKPPKNSGNGTEMESKNLEKNRKLRSSDLESRNLEIKTQKILIKEANVESQKTDLATNLKAKFGVNLEKISLESYGLETDVLNRILDSDYEEFEQGQLEKMENIKKDLVFENSPSPLGDLGSENLANLNKAKNSDTIDKQNTKQSEKIGKKVRVLIFSTGVGCEPFLSQPDGNLPWSEKKIWQNLWQEFISVETFNQKLEQKIQK
jgi:hypothetical protein